MVGGRGFKEQANHGQNVAPREHEPVQDTFEENFMGKYGNEDLDNQTKGWRNESNESHPL
jgi:hypothetical protein